MVFDSKEFAKAIVLKRVLEGRLSLRKCATLCGVNFSNLSRYERQEVEPTMTHFLQVCKWLEVEPTKFLILE